MPSYLQPHENGVYLAVKLQPRASRNALGQGVGNELKIQVTAPPVEAAANEALVRLLADVLDCPRRNVQLVRGHTSRHKVVFLADTTVAAVAARLHGH